MNRRAAQKSFVSKATEKYSFGYDVNRDVWVMPSGDRTVSQLIKGEIHPKDREVAFMSVIRADLQHADGVSLRWLGMEGAGIKDDKVYRVSVVPDGVLVICFGLESIDSGLDGHYDCVDALPNWVQERLAVLMITPSTPPTYEVEGVGRRISSHVYWVFAPESTS